MKSNWTINCLVIIVISIFLARPIGYLYGKLVAESHWFINIDPNNYISGFIITLSLQTAIFSMIFRQPLYLLANIILIIGMAWLGAIKDVFLLIVIGIIGVLVGYTLRKLMQHSPKFTATNRPTN